MTLYKKSSYHYDTCFSLFWHFTFYFVPADLVELAALPPGFNKAA